MSERRILAPRDFPYSENYCPPELNKDVLHYFGGSQHRWFGFGAEHACNNTWAEFGVGGGYTTRHLQHFLSEDGKFFLFDSWEGIPEEWHLSENHVEPVGMWKYKRFASADRRLEIVDGLFQGTLPYNFPEQLGLVHIDCDLYSSTKTVLVGCDDYLRDGTVLIFDEYYGYKFYADHERKACQEWLEETGKRIEWIARDDFGAMGIVRED